MNIEEFRNYCLSKQEVTESFPFDDTTLVFKVANKIFSLTSIEGDFWINLKCNPDKAVELRQNYRAINPGYHMNKKHWNTINIDGSLSVEFIKELIDHSYELIVKSLPKKDRERFGF